MGFREITHIFLISILIIFPAYNIFTQYFRYKEINFLLQERISMEDQIQNIKFEIENKNDDNEIEKQAWKRCLMCKGNAVIISHDL